MKAKIKKFIGLSAGFLIVVGPALAQIKPRENIQWGFNLGVNASYLDIFAKNTLFDFYGGLSAEIPLANRLAFRAGLAYSRKGADGSLASWGMLTVVTPIRLRVQYLEVPLLIKLSPVRSLYLEGGLYGAVKVGGSLTVRRYQDSSDLIEGTDIGYVLGIGSEFRFLGRRQYSGFRYSRGFSRVLSNGDNHNITFTYLLGVYF